MYAILPKASPSRGKEVVCTRKGHAISQLLEITVLNDPKGTAKLANEILEFVCCNPPSAYALAITRHLKAVNGPKSTNSIDVSSVLQMLVKEDILKALLPVRGGGGKLRKMYGPTWKAFFYMNLSKNTVKGR